MTCLSSNESGNRSADMFFHPYSKKTLFPFFLLSGSCCSGACRPDRQRSRDTATRGLEQKGEHNCGWSHGRSADWSRGEPSWADSSWFVSKRNCWRFPVLYKEFPSTSEPFWQSSHPFSLISQILCVKSHLVVPACLSILLYSHGSDCYSWWR